MSPAARSPAAPTPLRVGLIGYGLGGATFHAPLVAATAAMELAAIVTRDAGRRADAARRHPSARLLTSAAELYDPALGIDLVVVSSPSGTHASLAREALEQGRHVVIDKPVAASAREVAELARLARAADRLAIPFQNRRWDGDFLTLRALMREGVLGRIHRLESRFERWRPVPRPRWRERGARGSAEGIVYDIGSHLVDQALVLLGPAVRVHAELARVRPGVQVEDDAFIAIEHAGGARSHLYLSAAAAAAGARFTLSGEHGAYVKHGLDPQEERLKAGADPRAAGWSREDEAAWGVLTVEGAALPRPTEDGAYASFYPAVAAAIRKGAAPPVTMADAHATLTVIEAAFLAATGRDPILPA